MSQSISEGVTQRVEEQGPLTMNVYSVRGVPDGQNAIGAYNECCVSTPSRHGRCCWEGESVRPLCGLPVKKSAGSIHRYGRDVQTR
jgi:hypothetical protein